MSDNNNILGGLFYLVAVIYAFVFWGFWWGVLNLFFPFSIIYDLVVHVIGRL